jgi:hypothetical protein
MVELVRILLIVARNQHAVGLLLGLVLGGVVVLILELV